MNKIQLHTYSYRAILMSGFVLLCCSALCASALEEINEHFDRRDIMWLEDPGAIISGTSVHAGSAGGDRGPPAINSLVSPIGQHQIYSPSRQKRSFFLKKKILGAGLFGFGVGVAKGYKVGYLHRGGIPEVHHVYVAAPPSPPSVQYIEYVEKKPVYIERIVERPVLKHAGPDGLPEHSENEPLWSPSLRSGGESSPSSYGYQY